MILACPKYHEGGMAGDNFCWLCGEKLIPMETPRCGCGTHLRNDDKFCVNCGKNRMEIEKEIRERKNKNKVKEVKIEPQKEN